MASDLTMVQRNVSSKLLKCNSIIFGGGVAAAHTAATRRYSLNLSFLTH